MCGSVPTSFSHEALVYGSGDELAAGVVPFVREGLDAGERLMVALPPRSLEVVERGLGADAARAGLVDMTTLGRNPARIIAAWRDFLVEDDGSPARGVGEPAWKGRDDEELAEVRRHEELLNLAFSGGPAWRLLCPYDAVGLPADVVAEASETHPTVVDGDGRQPSVRYREPARQLDATPLDPPPGDAEALPVTAGELGTIRRLVEKHGIAAGLDANRVSDLVLAVDEVAANSVRHGGDGRMLIWRDGPAVVCEVRDRGRLTNPLVGRSRPLREQLGGRGLWLVNELCDLTQMRATESGNVMRMRVAAD